MKVAKRKRLSRVLIGTGIALLLASGIYEGTHYPWRQLLHRMGLVELTEVLPDPKPLQGGTVVLSADGKGESMQKVTVPDFFPGNTAKANLVLNQVGVIKIPRISLSENIVEGSAEELFHGVGHVEGTAAFGQEGNCVLAGHRIYMHMRPFRYLDKVEIGDRVYVEDKGNTYVYEVFKLFEAEETEIFYLDPQPEESHLLTLITCTPVINPTTRRLMVWCRFVETVEKTESSMTDTSPSVEAR